MKEAGQAEQDQLGNLLKIPVVFYIVENLERNLEIFSIHIILHQWMFTGQCVVLPSIMY